MGEFGWWLSIYCLNNDRDGQIKMRKSVCRSLKMAVGGQVESRQVALGVRERFIRKHFQLWKVAPTADNGILT